jgi:phosphotriesterase-related protein
LATIPTLDGPLDTAQLGTVLMHEHIFNLTAEIQHVHPGFNGWDPEVQVPKAQEQLRAVKEAGIDTIVDMTVPGLGRQVQRVARAAEGTGLNIIAVTGYYTYTDLPFPLKYNGKGKLFNNDDEDSFLVDLFVRDIEEGIEGTDIRAGVVKCCTDLPGVTEDIERLIRAVAKTHLRTDVPIMTHSHAKSRRGLDQQRILREEGVDLSRVLIGHSNETGDLDYLIELLDNGSYLGFDRCGLKIDQPLEDQQETLVQLCKRG